MKLEGKVLSAVSEEREMLGKDGVKQKRNVSTIVLIAKVPEDGVTPVYTCRTFDEGFSLPKVGVEYVTPRIKKYECYNGVVADVTF